MYIILLQYLYITLYYFLNRLSYFKMKKFSKNIKLLSNYSTMLRMLELKNVYPNI